MKCSGGFNRHISDRLMDREQYAPPTPSWDYSPIDNMSGDPPATTPHPKKKRLNHDNVAVCPPNLQKIQQPPAIFDGLRIMLPVLPLLPSPSRRSVNISSLINRLLTNSPDGSQAHYTSRTH